MVFCTCPSWRFQRNSPSNRTCKHIEQWKRDTLVGGVSLATVLGPGPVAIRAKRGSKKAPLVSDSPVPETYRPTSWERLAK